MSKKNDSNSNRPMTVPRFIKKKQAGTKLTMLTAYDFPTAKLLDEAGVDALLVGDSLAMVVQGRETTLPVTLDEMIYHGEMVARAAKRALVVVDIPFPINHHGVRSAVKAAGKIMKQTGCNAVKLEGGAEQAEVIEALVIAGIPVIAHVGLRPQAVNVMGGYKVQRDRDSLMADAIAAEKAGAFSIVLECIPADIAKEISEKLTIPTIGIGAGPDCDGQVLVVNDMLGATSGYVPSFVKEYANVAEMISKAVAQWTADVVAGDFPTDQQTF